MTRDALIEALQKLPETWDGVDATGKTPLPVEVCVYDRGGKEIGAVRYISGEHEDYILISG